MIKVIMVKSLFSMYASACKNYVGENCVGKNEKDLFSLHLFLIVALVVFYWGKTAFIFILLSKDGKEKRHTNQSKFITILNITYFNKVIII